MVVVSERAGLDRAHQSARPGTGTGCGVLASLGVHVCGGGDAPRARLAPAPRVAIRAAGVGRERHSVRARRARRRALRSRARRVSLGARRRRRKKRRRRDFRRARVFGARVRRRRRPDAVRGRLAAGRGADAPRRDVPVRAGGVMQPRAAHLARAGGWVGGGDRKRVLGVDPLAVRRARARRALARVRLPGRRAGGFHAHALAALRARARAVHAHRRHPRGCRPPARGAHGHKAVHGVSVPRDSRAALGDLARHSQPARPHRRRGGREAEPAPRGRWRVSRVGRDGNGDGDGDGGPDGAVHGRRAARARRRAGPAAQLHGRRARVSTAGVDRPEEPGEHRAHGERTDVRARRRVPEPGRAPGRRAQTLARRHAGGPAEAATRAGCRAGQRVRDHAPRGRDAGHRERDADGDARGGERRGDSGGDVPP